MGAAVTAIAIVDTNAFTASYMFPTTTHYWSVIGVATSADYDLSLYDVGGALLGTSTYGTGVTDFIAINSNLRPLGWVPDNDGVTGPGDPDLAFAAGGAAEFDALDPGGGRSALRVYPVCGGWPGNAKGGHSWCHVTAGRSPRRSAER